MQVAEGIAPIRNQGERSSRFSWIAIATSEAFWPAVLIALGLSTIFWTLFRFTYGKWVAADGYYSHGFLVPAIIGYVVYRWWPRLRSIPVKAGWIAVPPLLLLLWVAFAANRTDIYALLSLTLVSSMLLGTWFVAGWRWMAALAAPILYTLFALPVWDQVIQAYTNPLQLISTKVAFNLLKFMGYTVDQQDSTTIVMNRYQLDVGVACSGFKLLLALIAFAVFFMLIAKLKPWANLIFAASIVPLGLFVNGLRISLIGVVGNAYGSEAGAKFHDYSGYITIILCFFLLDRWAKLLGWNDKKEDLSETVPAALPPSAAKGLKTRAFAVAGMFLLCGAIVFAAPKPRAAAGRTEAWMEKTAPTQIGDFKVTSTYKMEPSTYQELQPYGIVCRIFSNKTQSYDVTLVASNRKTSFHDPKVCFPAQGWSFDSQKRVVVHTQTRGDIPMTIMGMTGEDKSTQLAAFFYRDKKGFYASPQALSWSMFLDQFAGHTDTEGVFYRFMPEHANAKEEDLTSFIARYMDEAPKTSGGFF
jgi:exosortase